MAENNAATVLNLQRKLPLDAAVFRDFVSSLPASVAESEGGHFSVAFVSDRRMIELNKFFRGKDSTTDVLSFPHEPDEFEPVTSDDSSTFLGDIVISAEQAARQAKENKLTLDREIKQLILHGLLHLCGYDHETDDGEMNRRELELRKKLKI
jgi:probable rRNA maturation factor